jgi:hypothetical protein
VWHGELLNSGVTSSDSTKKFVSEVKFNSYSMNFISLLLNFHNSDLWQQYLCVLSIELFQL